eukprot:TRINITY_DN5440_c0_g2_i1.p2 TRINITY_DN5440_c0_g2~~TRINITY_DN5440_c0_g2_i1.p2  ORF type:complete len:395 (+),score=164.39 TRINITY_DN5440_c0_g2_i1:97-1281(+)
MAMLSSRPTPGAGGPLSYRAAGERGGDADGGIIVRQREEIDRLKRELQRERERAGAASATDGGSVPSSPARSPRIRSTAPVPIPSATSTPAAAIPERSVSAASTTPAPLRHATPTPGGASSAARSVEELEDEVRACRRQLQSKHETIATVTEAIASAREEQKLLAEEMNLARLKQSAKAKRRDAAAGRRAGDEAAEATAALRRSIDMEIEYRRETEAAVEVLTGKHGDVQAALTGEKQRLMAEIDAARAALPAQEHKAEAGEFDADFESRLDGEKRKMLSTLQETKDALLEDFSVMRTRLRAKVSMLERSAESKQKTLEELYLSTAELEQKFSQVKESNHKLYENFRVRLDAQHAELTMAKAREGKAKQQLKAKNCELDDLRLTLHVELSGGRR